MNFILYFKYTFLQAFCLFMIDLDEEQQKVI